MLAWSMACAGSGGGAASIADPKADVVGVRAEGEAGAYTVFVSIESTETGCDLYADWWEVLTPEGALVYRRILDHSHPDEQPFERSGGPVAAQAADEVVVRAHLHPDGYVGAAMRGTFGGTFAPYTPEASFGADLATASPQPEGCLF